MTNSDYKYLKESPMFHFSLHAKELFHSNFLAWLGNDAELRPVFKAVMEGLGIDKAFVDSWGDDFEVLREKDNFDLVVKATDKFQDDKHSESGKWYVVIENKVKSIPTDRQIEEYTKKLKEYTKNSVDSPVEKLLLVITGDAKDLVDGWRRVNYTQVCDALIKSLPLVTNSYKKAIIEDYIKMVEALIAIVKDVSIDKDSAYLYIPSEELNDLRIADLVEKWRAANIANMFTAETGSNSSPGYTNKQSLIETCITVEDVDVKIGIQIQGCQYRRFIMGNIKEGEIVKASKGFLSNNREEFRNNMLSLYPGVFEDKFVRGEKKRDYCSYGKKTDGKTFWYQYVVIKKDTTIGQIMDCIAKDMQKIKELFLIHA